MTILTYLHTDVYIPICSKSMLVVHIKLGRIRVRYKMALWSELLAASINIKPKLYNSAVTDIKI